MQRGWYIGKYVHNKTRDYYRAPANSIPGLVYHETGPDFTYQATVNDPVTYFELLTSTKLSRERHNDRHGGYLWRAVFYTFGVAGPDVSDIE